jgi:hypothetical protein
MPPVGFESTASAAEQPQTYALDRTASGIDLLSSYVFLNLHLYSYHNATSLVAWWSGLLTTSHEVPGSIPGPAVGIFPHRGRSPWWPWSG